MAINVQNHVWSLDLPAHLKYVAIALADHAHADGTNARPSQVALAAKTGLTDRSIRRALGELCARGVIRKVSVGNTGKATSYAFLGVPETIDPGRPRPGYGGVPRTPTSGNPGRPRPVTPDTHVLLTVRNHKEPRSGDVEQQRTATSQEPSFFITGSERLALLEKARQALGGGGVGSSSE